MFYSAVVCALLNSRRTAISNAVVPATRLVIHSECQKTQYCYAVRSRKSHLDQSFISVILYTDVESENCFLQDDRSMVGLGPETYLINVCDGLRVHSRHVNVALALGNPLQDPAVSKHQLNTKDMHVLYRSCTVIPKLIKGNSTA